MNSGCILAQYLFMDLEHVYVINVLGSQRVGGRLCTVHQRHATSGGVMWRRPPCSCLHQADNGGMVSGGLTAQLQTPPFYSTRHRDIGGRGGCALLGLIPGAAFSQRWFYLFTLVYSAHHSGL